MKEKPNVINMLFALLICSSIIYAGFNGKMQEITDASFQSAKEAVNLIIALIGIMSFWLGLMKVLEDAGFISKLSCFIRPLMRYLFKDVPLRHPAMNAIVLNICANILGLGNAATPLGIKAMIELNKLNPFKGIATNAMVLFLAINTSAITLFPLGVIGLRAAAGTSRPADIFLPTLIATTCSTIVGIFASLWLSKRDKIYIDKYMKAYDKQKLFKCVSSNDDSNGLHSTVINLKYNKFSIYSFIFYNKYYILIYIILILLFIIIVINVCNYENILLFLTEQLISFWLMPCLILFIICYGIINDVSIYNAIIDGAAQSFAIGIKIIPFLVPILVAIGMFRASGAMDLLIMFCSPVTDIIKMPAETLPMALIKPLSGQGSFAIMNSLIQKDPDSYSAFVASVMQGSTETTFYILAVYYGSIGITNIRHTLIVALCADIIGIITACLSSAFFYCYLYC